MLGEPRRTNCKEFIKEHSSIRSTRKLAGQLRISQYTVLRLMEELGLKEPKYTSGISEGIFNVNENYCWLTGKRDE